MARGRRSSTGTRERAWTRWSSKRQTRTSGISSPSTKTSRTLSSPRMTRSKCTWDRQATILDQIDTNTRDPSRFFCCTAHPLRRGNIAPLTGEGTEPRRLGVHTDSKDLPFPLLFLMYRLLSSRLGSADDALAVFSSPLRGLRQDPGLKLPWSGGNPAVAIASPVSIVWSCC